MARKNGHRPLKIKLDKKQMEAFQAFTRWGARNSSKKSEGFLQQVAKRRF